MQCQLDATFPQDEESTEPFQSLILCRVSPDEREQATAANSNDKMLKATPIEVLHLGLQVRRDTAVLISRDELQRCIL
jgi:hypothetical protein